MKNSLKLLLVCALLFCAAVTLFIVALNTMPDQVASDVDGSIREVQDFRAEISERLKKIERRWFGDRTDE